MRRSIELERALRAGDLAAARVALEEPDAFPNAIDTYLGTTVLQRALYVAPGAAVTALLDAGADPAFAALDGFPALLLVLLHRDEPDRTALVTALVEHGAPLDERGVNDWTALHVAAARGDDVVVRVLLDAGADPGVRTRIDDLTTPADEAAHAGHDALAAVLRAAEAG